MTDNFNLKDIQKKNEQNRIRLRRMQCIRIKDIIQDPGFMGGYQVIYDDYRYRCEDFAAITDILSWIKWGEIYVDNFGIIKARI